MILDLIVPCYSNRLRNLKRCDQSLPVNWCDLIDTKARSNENQSWMERLPFGTCNSHKLVFVDIWTISS